MSPNSETELLTRRDQSSSPIDRNKIVRLGRVLELTGVSRSMVYLMIGQGRFPAAVPLGVRARGWLEAEVVGWLTERVAERDLAKGA